MPGKVTSYDVDIMDALSTVTGLNTIWQGICSGCRAAFGYQIRITWPGPGDTPTEGERLGPENRVFPVRGKLKRLPKDDKVVLIIQDEPTSTFRPQTFYPVQFNPDEHSWEGQVNVGQRTRVKIFAVVAPPAAQDLFRYYEKFGELRGHQFESITRIPVECGNQDSVQAIVPD